MKLVDRISRFYWLALIATPVVLAAAGLAYILIVVVFADLGLVEVEKPYER